jgi:hypothetical protein
MTVPPSSVATIGMFLNHPLEDFFREHHLAFVSSSGLCRGYNKMVYVDSMRCQSMPCSSHSQYLNPNYSASTTSLHPVHQKNVWKASFSLFYTNPWICWSLGGPQHGETANKKGLTLLHTCWLYRTFSLPCLYCKLKQACNTHDCAHQSLQLERSLAIPRCV